MTVDVANGELKQILEECLTPSARHGLKIYGGGKLFVLVNFIFARP